MEGTSVMLLVLIVRAWFNDLLKGVLFTLEIDIFVIVEDLLIVGCGDSKATSICSHLLPTYHRI